MKQTLLILLTLLFAVASNAAGAATQRGQQSPAAQQPPETLRPQFYPVGQIAAGQGRFVARCGFCHGRDTGGGEGGGPDLTRSTFVAEDVYGNKIRTLLRSGRPDSGMPAFDLEDWEVDAIVAFVHDQKREAETALGGRRAVAPEDLETGDPSGGQAYFNGAGGCTECHSPTDDLAGIGSRFEGLNLLRRMLYPTFGRPAPAPATLTVTLPSGETVSGPLVTRSEFRVALRDADGTERSWETGSVEFAIDDPISAHFDQLGRYTDQDMHDVYAYLTTLK